MKTNTVTISVFPTYKEISALPVYLGGTGYQAVFENVFVGEAYDQDREQLESTVTKLIDAGLNGIKGRSTAKTKLQKINFLLEYGYGYYFNSNGKITCKGSEQSPECDFYGNTTAIAPQPAAVKPAPAIAIKPAPQPAAIAPQHAAPTAAETADRAVEVNLPYLGNTVASWWNTRNTDSDKVSVVGDRRDPAETTNYCCYGSDALKIASATNYKITEIRMWGNLIPVFTLPKSDMRRLTETLKAAGITLKVWY